MSLLGQTLGAYLIREQLAEGRSSVVYLAEDAQRRREVALKVPRSEITSDRALAGRYLRACNLAELRDRGLFVPILDASSDEDGRLWIALELCRGRTLDRVLAEEGALSSERAARITRVIAEALASLHKRGRAYGGLEPRKVMVEGAGGEERVRLLEAELSDLVPEKHPAQAYLAPERSTGGAPTVRTDIFALGVLLHQLSTGSPPGAGASSAGASGLLELASELRAPDPARRPAHAGLVLTALDRLGFGGPAVGVGSGRPVKRADSTRPKKRADSERPSPAAPPPRVSGTVPSRKRWPGLLLGLALIGGAAAAFAVVRQQDEVEAPRLAAAPDAAIAEPVVAAPPEPEPIEAAPDASQLALDASQLAKPAVADAGVVAAAAPAAPAAPADADAIHVLFVQLDGALGEALEARGLVWDDLVAAEPVRTKQWGRWYRRAEVPPESSLREHYRALDRAVGRAAAQRPVKTSTGA